MTAIVTLAIMAAAILAALVCIGVADAKDRLAAVEREHEQCQCDYHKRETFK